MRAYGDRTGVEKERGPAWAAGAGRGPGGVAEPRQASGLLDGALAAVPGPAGPVTAEAITGICDDAVSSILGPELAAAVRADRRLLPLVAPWAWDLARGLQFQNRYGPGEPATSELLAMLAGRPLPGEQAEQFAGTVDLAVALTLGRVLAQVLGPGACARDPAADQAAAPWLAGLKLGYRIGLAAELLRLSSSG